MKLLVLFAVVMLFITIVSSSGEFDGKDVGCEQPSCGNDGDKDKCNKCCNNAGMLVPSSVSARDDVEGFCKDNRCWCKVP